jgi:outer membrane protein insertion porin family
LRPRVVFTRTKVQQDVQRILDLYRASGRFAATVDPKVIRLPQNRADLVFEINEGPLTEVRNIRFIGNHEMSDSTLRGVIRTKETAWYRFFSTADTYDPDRLTLDRELLRRFYLKEGFADFRVNSAVAELTADKSAFFITFSLEEGERYKFGKIDIKSTLRGFDPETVKDQIDIEEGDWYDASAVDKAIDVLTDAIGNLGYAFVEVRPRIKRHREEKTIDVSLEIGEGPRIFVERIEISGNVRTVDEVIRREMQLVEGDAYSTAKERKSQKRLEDLDFFESVKVERVPGSEPDKAVINVEVEEKSTGSLGFGVGFSTSEGPLVDVTLRERNLLGRAYDLSLSGTLAASRSQLNLGFTNPYFLDREVAAGFDVFRVSTDQQDSSSFDKTDTGFDLRAGYPITDNLSQNWAYTFKRTEITDVGSSASALIRAQEGNNYLSEVSHSLIYDMRDSRINPTDGYIAGLTNDVAGLGGTTRYLRNVVRAAYYYPITDDFIFHVNGRAGHIFGLGQDVKIQDRFFVGGDRLRGFAAAGIGPRDAATGDALGGEWMYAGTVELRFPLGLPEEFQVSGRLFADAGSVGTVNPSSPTVVDSKNIRASVGVGVSYISPFGPIGVDFGYPVVKDSLDDVENFRINVGTRF